MQISSKRESILKAAADILARNPGASFTELAPAIGISRATLYRHFAQREELIRALAMYALHEYDKKMNLIDKQNLPPLEKLKALLGALLPMGEQFHFLSKEWEAIDDPEIADIYNRQSDGLVRLIQAAKDDGSIAQDTPTAWIVQALEALIYAAWESVEAGDIARNDAPSLVYRTLMEGFGV